MSSLAWLKNAGEQYLERIRAEAPVFLIEVEISPEESVDLLENLGRCRALPWESWAHACVAVAAIQVARDAPGDERSFPRLFMKRLRLRYSQQMWEEDYGRRIEVLLRDRFPDDFHGHGAFRYVGPVYRHAGIPAIALPRFGHFLRLLLSDYGPAFTRQDYETARQRVSGVASRFLGSEHGFHYARNAVSILYHIDTGLIPTTELASIPGYRRDFWAEIIARAGSSETVVHHSTRVTYSEPILALSVQDARLVLRFDPRAVDKGVVRIDGRTVLYSEVTVTSVDAPRIEIDGQLQQLDRWWTPGQSQAALFGKSDGRFVASEGGVPAGEYYLVVQECVVPGNELSPDELDYLTDSGYRIWRITVAPGMCIPGCNLRATGSNPFPQIEFARSRPHVLGPNVFEDYLPDLILRHWDIENARRFWLFFDDGHGTRRLEVAAGKDRFKLNVSCPAMGAIWVEARGFYRQPAALPHLPFTLLPRGIAIDFPQQCFWIDDPAFGRFTAPTGWRIDIRSPYVQTQSGLWQIPGRERVLSGALENGELLVPFSVRVPRAAIYMQPRDRIWWEEIDVPERQLHIEGVPGLCCSLWLMDDRGSHEMIAPFRMGPTGTAQLRALEFRDALALSCVTAGEFALRISGAEPLRTGWYFASEQRIRKSIESLPDSALAFKLPGIGQMLRATRDLHARELATFDCDFSKEECSLRDWLSVIALCAQTFDGTRLSTDISEYAGSAIQAVCDWYKRAVFCTSLGAESAKILKLGSGDPAILPLRRWREKLQQQMRRLESQSNVAGLITSWRDAVRRRDGSAMEMQLAKRSGGEQLTEGARKYLIGMQTSGRTKNQALNGAIGCFHRSFQTTNCAVIRAVAAGLLELAYNHSDRSEQVADTLQKEYQAAAISPADFSPWEGDYGTSIRRIRTVATNSSTTEKQ